MYSLEQIQEKHLTDALKVFLLTLSALFPIVDPLAGSPIFLAMTYGYERSTRRALSWRVAFNSLVLMIGSYFVGAHVLTFLGSRYRSCRSAEDLLSYRWAGAC